MKNQTAMEPIRNSPSIEGILREEAEQVERARALRLDPDADRPSAEASLVGLAFSGGGIGKIRSTGQPPRATAHYAVGTIHYCPGVPERDGVLIYLKPALVATDAADVRGYASRNSAFPNDSTANQWFDESHFENYRAMGEATGRSSLPTIQAAIQQLLYRSQQAGSG